MPASSKQYFESKREIADQFLEILELGKKDGTFHPDRCCREIILPILNNFGIFSQQLTISYSVLKIRGDPTPVQQLKTISQT
ncbi:hypothetical protein [Salinicoccus sp. HZC-1]|uniref:hypothetical protein n=1 Tax=Salinicoccus sp. HZC-1 TaxID=3385497 RepID=UPI00398AE06A